MFVIVARLRRRARTMPRRSPLTSVTPALSMATSVPVPMAMPDLRLRQRRRVVDAVARHRDEPALGLEALDRVRFLIRQHLRHDVVDAETARHRLRGRAVVAGQHDDLQALGVQCRIASGVVALIGSATPSSPAGCPSTATNITVCPSARSSSARAASGPGSTRSCCSNARLPSATAWPSTVPVTPLPLIAWKSAGFEQVHASRRGPATIAPASGCSLPCSRLAASRSTRHRPGRLGERPPPASVCPPSACPSCPPPGCSPCAGPRWLRRFGTAPRRSRPFPSPP